MLAFGVKWIKLLKVPDLIVLRSDSFTHSLSNILIYIAHDSKNRARQFNKTLQASLKELPNMPYKFRKSIYFIPLLAVPSTIYFWKIAYKSTTGIVTIVSAAIIWFLKILY